MIQTSNHMENKLKRIILKFIYEDVEILASKHPGIAQKILIAKHKTVKIMKYDLIFFMPLRQSSFL